MFSLLSVLCKSIQLITVIYYVYHLCLQQEETLTFQGFIRVHMNLMRPISMTLPMRPPSIYDVISSDGETSDEGEGGDHDTLTTSFYLPKDTTKVIHITR